jgi:hypothetical protein
MHRGIGKDDHRAERISRFTRQYLIDIIRNVSRAYFYRANEILEIIDTNIVVIWRKWKRFPHSYLQESTGTIKRIYQDIQRALLVLLPT